MKKKWETVGIRRAATQLSGRSIFSNREQDYAEKGNPTGAPKSEARGGTGTSSDRFSGEQGAAGRRRGVRAAGGNGLPESGPVDGVDAVGEQVDGKDPGNQKEEKGVEDSLWDGKGGGVLQDGFHEGEKDGQNDHRQDKKANDFGEQGDEVVGDKRGVVRNHRLIPSLSCLGRARPVER